MNDEEGNGAELKDMPEGPQKTEMERNLRLGLVNVI